MEDVASASDLGRFHAHMQMRKIKLFRIEEQFWPVEMASCKTTFFKNLKEIDESLSRRILWMNPRIFLSNGRLVDYMWEKQALKLSEYQPQLQIDIRAADSTMYKSRFILWMNLTGVEEHLREDKLEGLRRPLQRFSLTLLESTDHAFSFVSFERLGRAEDEFPCLLPLISVIFEQYLTRTSHLKLHDIIGRCCHVLGNAALDTVELVGCRLKKPNSFLQGLRTSDNGPVILIVVDYRDELFLESLLFALKRNSRLKRLSLQGGVHTSLSGSGKALETLLLRNNSLIALEFVNTRIEDRVWERFWMAMAENKAIESLDLRWTLQFTPHDRGILTTSPKDVKRITDRTRCVATALLRNKSLRQLAIVDAELNPEIWMDDIAPRLQRNDFLPRFEAIAEIDDVEYRAGLLCHALAKLTGKLPLQFLCVRLNVEAFIERLLIPEASHNVNGRCMSTHSVLTIDSEYTW